MLERRLTIADRIIIRMDKGLRSFAGDAAGIGSGTGRPNPAGDAPGADLTERERRHVAGLMRVDHAGEVAAQALYHGQALMARTREVRASLEQAAAEENDHLTWCRERLGDLGARPSRLDPLWYAGSFAIGAAAGVAGDRWSQGFVVETERQVIEHLDSHLDSLPAGDGKSRAILEQMRVDEARHATNAMERGAAALPNPVRRLMRRVARVMTGIAYWV